MPKSLYHKINNINLLLLTGTKKQMGSDYGDILREQLLQSLDILKNYYTNLGVSYEALINKADLFYNRYPEEYKDFIEGISEGSGINMDDCKILLAMETLNSLLTEGNNSELSACAFIFNDGMIGRNYDFFKPFDDIAQFLSVIILYEKHQLPLSFISMPGQIYCTTCINSQGLFAEFNNGMPSGGYFVDIHKETLLANLLISVQHSNNLAEFEQRMHTLQADYSLIINAAHYNESRSYEFSSNRGMKIYHPSSNQPYSSTNFFHNDSWIDIPLATDENTWLGVSRRDNLLHLLKEHDNCDMECLKTLMSIPISEGGAMWEHTIYQIAYNPYTQIIYLKIPVESNEWTEIHLAEYFYDM